MIWERVARGGNGGQGGRPKPPSKEDPPSEEKGKGTTKVGKKKRRQGEKGAIKKPGSSSFGAYGNRGRGDMKGEGETKACLSCLEPVRGGDPRGVSPRRAAS